MKLESQLTSKNEADDVCVLGCDSVRVRYFDFILLIKLEFLLIHAKTNFDNKRFA